MDKILEMKIVGTCEGYEGQEPTIIYDVWFLSKEDDKTWIKTVSMTLDDLKDIQTFVKKVENCSTVCYNINNLVFISFLLMYLSQGYYIGLKMTALRNMTWKNKFFLITRCFKWQQVQ